MSYNSIYLDVGSVLEGEVVGGTCSGGEVVGGTCPGGQAARLQLTRRSAMTGGGTDCGRDGVHWCRGVGVDGRRGGTEGGRTRGVPHRRVLQQRREAGRILQRRQEAGRISRTHARELDGVGAGAWGGRSRGCGLLGSGRGMRRPGVAQLPGAAGRISRRPTPPLDACGGAEAGAWLDGEVIHGAGLASPAGRVHGRDGSGVHGRGGVGTCTGRGGGWGG